MVNINWNAFLSRDIYHFFNVKINIPVHRGQLEVKLSFKSNIYTHNHIIRIGLNIEITMNGVGCVTLVELCVSSYVSFKLYIVVFYFTMLFAKLDVTMYSIASRVTSKLLP